MTNALASVDHPSGPVLPALIARAGERAAWRFVEFFTGNIRNANTRAAMGELRGSRRARHRFDSPGPCFWTLKLP